VASRSIKRTVLVIDDDKLLCDTIAAHLPSEGMEVLAAHSLAEGLQVCSQRKVDVLLLDQKLPDGEGHSLCPSILDCNEQTKIIFITGYPSFEDAVKAIRAGAHDYLCKPFELGEVDLAVQRLLRTLELENTEQLQHYKEGKEREESVLVGDGLAPVRRLVALAASSEAPVLITGETGSGKNLTARAIHYASPRRDHTFIGVNCTALPENLIEAELFGHAKGAFTGAATAHRGIFEMAEGGTLFLDEIGEMPLHLQSKLLSVLEDKVVRRLGGETVRPVDVRIIAATGIDTETSLGETFRKDLFYRLSVIRIHMPPLRQRRQDIPELSDFLLKKIAWNRVVEIPDCEMEKLVRYPWPGNVRELRNILERAVILQKGPALRPSEMLGPAAEGRDIPDGGEEAAAACSPGGHGQGIRPLEEVERNHIQCALESRSGNLTQTAKALGISLSTLKRKLKGYSLK